MYADAKEGAIYYIAIGYNNTDIVSIGDTKSSGIGSSISDLKYTDIISDIATNKFTGGGVYWRIDGKINNSGKARRGVVIIIAGCGDIGMPRSSFCLCCIIQAFGAKFSIFNNSSSFYSGILKYLTKAINLL